MQTLLIILCTVMALALWVIAGRLISISSSIHSLNHRCSELADTTRYILEKTGIMSRFPFKSSASEEVK